MAMSPEERKRHAERMRERRRAAGAKPRGPRMSDEERNRRSAERMRERRAAAKEKRAGAPSDAISVEAINLKDANVKVVSAAQRAVIKDMVEVAASLPVEKLEKILGALRQVRASAPVQAVAPVQPVEEALKSTGGVRYPKKSIAARERERKKWLENREERYQQGVERIKEGDSERKAAGGRIASKLSTLRANKSSASEAATSPVAHQNGPDEIDLFAAELEAAVASVPRPNINPRDLVDEIMREKRMRKELGL